VAGAENHAECQQGRFPITVDGSGSVEALASSCLQPDGSLDVTQETPGLPVQTYHLAAASVTCGDAGQPACDRLPIADAAAGCRDYNLPVVVNGSTLNATRRACPQPDGSWTVTQTVPGLAAQTYTVPAPASADAYAYPASGYYPYYPYYPYDPYYSYYPYYPN
jgi:hypothetical protein